MLKKILLALMFVITATTNVTYAEDDMKTVASKAYVDTKIETKQLKIPAAGQPNVGAGETVMTYTATGNGQIGERGLYSDISSYDATTDGDKLITASALNATFTNLPTTPTTKLECANSPACTLWTIVDQTAYGNGLPSGYTRLEYIQSTGTQYIDTGVTLSNDIEIVAKVGTSAANTLGITADVGLIVWQSGGRINFRYIPSEGNVITLSTDARYYTNQLYDVGFNINKSTFTVNGQTVAEKAVDIKNVGAKIRTGKQDLTAALKIYDGSNLVRNMIPAKNSNDVLGMYDTVSGTFFTNAATDGPDFTAGPPVQ